MEKLLWAHLNNPLRALNTKDGQAQGSSRKRGKVMKRAVAHDAYRREHPEQYDEAVKGWVKDHGSQPDLNDRNKISYNVFNKLSNQEKKVFKDKAIAAVKESRKLARITDPKERAKFTQQFWTSLREFLTEVSEMAGIEVCALVVHETEDGQTRVTRELSAGIDAFSSSPALAKSMDALKSFLETAGGPNGALSPQPCVYPDFTRDGYPCLPNFRGWSLKRLRKLLRDYIKALFKFQGGFGRMIWQEIKKAMHYWLDPRRLPKVEGLVWDDPYHLRKEMVLIWLEFFLGCLTGVIPPEECFQFLRIPAGPAPIHPSDSQETGRELVERDGKMVYVLTFGNKVDKSHRLGGMTYDQRAIDYAKYVAFGSDHANATSAPPVRWLGLPSLGPNTTLSAFSGEELERLTAWALLLPEPAQSRVRTIIEVTNAYQAHIPAIHPIGVWLRESELPLVFPRTPDDASRASTSFWLPPYYFKPAVVAALAGTVYYFEVCQNEMHDGELILHKPSNTLYGGDTGVVSIVRALVQVYLNCLVARGDFRAPEELPPGYELSRFSVQDHDLITGWIDKWIALIKNHTEILSQTSSERKAGLAELTVRVSSKDSDDGSSNDTDAKDSELHVRTDPVPSNTPQFPSISAAPSTLAHDPSTARLSRATKGERPKRARKVPDTDEDSEDSAGLSKVAKGKRPERAPKFADYDESTEDSRDSDVDFEVLDVTSQDEKSSDEEDLNLFNERFLDDDIFPTSDPIGLRERYEFNRFNPEVDFQFVTALEPFDGSSAEHLQPPKKGEPLFGGFPELRPYKAPRITRPETVIRHLIAVGREAHRAKHTWLIYNQANPRFMPEMKQVAKGEAELFPLEVRPLIRLMYNRMLSWLRARAMAPYVFAQWQAMSYILREALALFATAERFIDADRFPNPEFTSEDLINQVKRTKLQVVELSYITSELRDWYDLACRATEKLEGSWMTESVPPLGSMIEIVDGIAWWIEETYELGVAHVEDRPKIWEKISDNPFKPAKEGVNYLFGCATSMELPNGLYDTLEAARKMDPSAVVQMEVAREKAEVRDIRLVLVEALPAIVTPVRPPTSSHSPAGTIGTAPPTHVPSAGDSTAVVDSSPKAPTTSTLGHGAEGDREMDVDTLDPSTSAPPASSKPKWKRPKPRVPPEEQPSQEIDEQPRNVDSTSTSASTTQPNPLSPEKSATKSTDISTETSTAEGVRAENEISKEDAGEISGTSTSSQRHDSSPPSSKNKRKPEDKAEVGAPDPSPPSPPVVTKSKASRKRKLQPETETEMETAQGKRTSVRLREKSGGAMANVGAKQGENARRSSARINRK